MESRLNRAKNIKITSYITVAQYATQKGITIQRVYAMIRSKRVLCKTIVGVKVVRDKHTRKQKPTIPH